MNRARTKSAALERSASELILPDMARASRSELSASTGSSAKAVNITAGLPTPQDVAAALIRFASLEQEPDFLTHLRLQKLMYYVQAWSLAQRKRPAFIGRIEAWAHGPVVKELYATLAKYGYEPIPVDALPNQSPLSTADVEFVSSVWDAYKGFTAFALRSMTHNEAPWINARGDLGAADACTNQITSEAMEAYFSQAK